MSFIYSEFIYRPIFNLLIFLYNVIPGNDIGIAIILLTIIIKLLLFPLSKKSIKAQRELQEIQPLMEEIKKKYKDNKEKMGVELMALYKKHNVNPAGSCLPLLIQLPFLMALYNVFLNGFKPESLGQLYSFIPNPNTINPLFVNFIDLSKNAITSWSTLTDLNNYYFPAIILAFIVGISQFWQTKMMIHTKQPKVSGSEDEDMMANVNKQMMYTMPIIMVIFGLTLPAGLGLYWLTNTIVTIIQQKMFFSKHYKPIISQGAIIEGEKIEDPKEIGKNKF